MSEDEIFSIEDGKLLIKFARENIEYYLKNDKRILIPDIVKDNFSDKYGTFVTLNKHDIGGNHLRGCIGYIEPKYALYDD